MKNHKFEHSVKSDISLLIFIFLIAVMAVGMMLTGHILVNMAFMGITLLLVVITYFLGLTIGLEANLIFIFGQAFYMVYLALSGRTVPIVLVFWLFLPVLLSIVVANLTEELRLMQLDNAKLKENLIENGAFDAETRLRTTVSFLEDAGVFTETSRRFDLPVSVVMIRIRYFSDMKAMLGDERVRELIHVASQTIRNATRDNDITYILNTTDPTWAVLVYTDEQGSKIMSDRIRAQFDTELKQSKTLAGMDLRFKIGAVSWDADAMQDATGLMNAGLKELEYDV